MTTIAASAATTTQTSEYSILYKEVEENSKPNNII